jgi:hypothetical protein
MTSNSTKLPVLGSDAEIAVGLLDEWFDPIEAGLRDRVREFIQTMIESELEAVLARPRYVRRPKADPANDGACGVAGHRHGHRSRSSFRCAAQAPAPIRSVSLCNCATASASIFVRSRGSISRILTRAPARA